MKKLFFFSIVLVSMCFGQVHSQVVSLISPAPQMYHYKLDMAFVNGGIVLMHQRDFPQFIDKITLKAAGKDYSFQAVSRTPERIYFAISDSLLAEISQADKICIRVSGYKQVCFKKIDPDQFERASTLARMEE